MTTEKETHMPDEELTITGVRPVHATGLDQKMAESREAVPEESPFSITTRSRRTAAKKAEVKSKEIAKELGGGVRF
jgi:hypothetical protein